MKGRAGEHDGCGVTTQFDLFGEVSAAHGLAAVFDALQADRQAAQHLDCCTGLPVPRGTHPGGRRCADGSPDFAQVRCGRCGRITAAGYPGGSHDAGWDGCAPADWMARTRAALAAVDRGETPNWWNRRPDVRRRPGTDPAAWLAARHDRRHHADCRCGHPWGWHDNETAGMWLRPRGRCWERCGCLAYRDGPNSPDRPSRWGTSWAPPAELVAALAAAEAAVAAMRSGAPC